MHENNRSLACAACDISTGGAKIRIGERLTLNSKVLLTIDRVGSFLGEIRWQRENYAAIRFLEEASTIEELLHRATLASSEVTAHPNGCPGATSRSSGGSPAL